MLLRFPAVLAFGALFFVSHAISAGAQGTGSTYEDEKYGFDIKTVRGWDQVPPEPTEKTVIARWAAERDIRGLPARMIIHAFDRSKEEQGDEVEERYRGGRVETFETWAKWNRRGLSLPEKREKLSVKGPEGLPISGEYFEATYESGYTIGNEKADDFYTVIGFFRTPRTEFVVELFISEESRRRFKSTFKKVIASFEFTENAGKVQNDDLSKLSPRERARARARAEATRVEGWWFEETPNYIIVTNLDKRKKRFVDDWKRRLETIRAQMEIDLPPVKPIDAVSIVRVCKDRDSYLAYGAPAGSAGYWYSAAEELVVYSEGEKNQTRRTLYHEAFHQYVYYAMGEVTPCITFNEGSADYYGGADIEGTRLRKIEVNRERIDTIKQACRDGTFVPVAEILEYSQGRYYSNPSLCYAQGWSLVWFLKTGLEDGHPWEEILPTYFASMKKEILATDRARFAEREIRKNALEAAFKDVDMKEFEEAWIDFITKERIAKK